MEKGYFTREKAMHRFFYIQGLTADSFYTDSLMQVDLEWLLFQELKKNGYKRILFYDKDWKLYCYDENSYQMMVRGKGEESQAAVAVERPRPKGGLRKGKWGKKEENKEKEEGAIQEKAKGVYSKILLAEKGNSRLHGGIQDNTMVFRQIDACMMDGDIKTAVIINDASDFIEELGSGRQHNMSNYMNLPPDNYNIMIFVFPDGKMLSLLEMKQLNLEDQIPENVISIVCPNALEIRNLLERLCFIGVREGKKQTRLKMPMREVLDIALDIKRYMQEDDIRIKSLYQLLVRFLLQGKPLNKENCHEIFGEKKHISAEVQLNRLIGMKKVKEELAQYKGKPVKSEQKLQYMTSSRLQPDLPLPKKSPKEMVHVLLTGSAGVGKTTVAKLIGQFFSEIGYLESGHVVESARDKLVAGYVGQTAIKTRMEVEKALGGVLFIDEAYSLNPSRGSAGERQNGDFAQEAIDTLVKVMDEYKGRFILVAAGYEKEMEEFVRANPGLFSRFTLRLHIDDYEPEEMKQILLLYLKEEGYRLSERLREKMDDFCENWVQLAGEEWGNAREAVNLKDKMKKIWEQDKTAETCIENGEEWHILEERHLPEEMKAYLQPVAAMRERLLEELNAMIGLTEVKKQIDSLRNRMLAGNLQYPGHYLFIGNPGTGKTTIARYMGRVMRNHGLLRRGHIKEYTAGDLVKQVERGASFRELAEQAVNGVLFIDEAYQLLDSHAGQRILGDLLPFMENHRKDICIVLAGYEEDMRRLLDHNVGLQDRFGKNEIRFENYSGQELQQILLKKLEQLGYEPDENYQEYALRALTRYVQKNGGDKNFGNARFLETSFIEGREGTLSVQAERLCQKYGDKIPEEEKKKLTGEDIPSFLQRYAKQVLEKKERKTLSALEQLESMRGFTEIKTWLKELLQLSEVGRQEGMEDLLEDLTLHAVLKGNPGVGKTTIVRLIAQIYKEIGVLERGHYLKVTRAELCGRYLGETEQKTKEVIQQAMGGVLFIDEAYTLKQEGESGNDYGQKAIDTILEAMSDKNGEFAVIAAGYPEKMEFFLQANPGFRSRFAGNIFQLPDYTDEELADVFVSICRRGSFEVEGELKAVLPQLFRSLRSRAKYDWANGREAENLEKRMRTEWSKNPIIRTDEEGNRKRIYGRMHLPQSERVQIEMFT